MKTCVLIRMPKGLLDGAKLPQNTFYDHFSRDKVTEIGAWLAKKSATMVFRFAGIDYTDSVLEIGPGRGFFADICLSAGAEYQADLERLQLENRRLIDIIKSKDLEIEGFENRLDAAKAENDVLKETNTNLIRKISQLEGQQ